MNGRPNIVLVHGAWADGSWWSGVIERLQAAGYHVTAPQFPMSSLTADVARLRQVLDFQDGPVIVAGHSYGGQIMTALGTDAPNVAGLVYIAAFGLDQGESLGALPSQGPTTPALENMFTDKQGFMWLSHDEFVQHFAADVDPVQAKVMYAVQQGLPAPRSPKRWAFRPGNRCRRGTWSPPRTRRSRRPRSRCSPAAWARPRPRSPPATSPWCPIRTR